MKSKYNAGVITVSTRASRGEYEDLSGEVLVELLKSANLDIIEKKIVGDDKDCIKKAIISLVNKNANLIITTGGTGLSESDVTPESCLELSSRIVPGISEAIRAKSAALTPNALLSRGVSVVVDRCLVINFPGSPKACREAFDVIKPCLEHALGLISGKKMDK